MRIRIDGTSTKNKGAELMLYAILNSISKFNANATVEFNMNPTDSYKECKKVKSSLNLIVLNKYKSIFTKLKIPAILKRLKLSNNYFTPFYFERSQPKIDILFDASGFKFSDTWEMDQYAYNMYYRYYSQLKKSGTFIVFLPQSFGPFNRNISLKIIKMIDTFANIIFARDKQSYKDLIKAGCDSNKVFLYPDFTATIKGTYNEKYEYLKGGIGIIPNKNMFKKTGITKNDYILFLNSVIDSVTRSGFSPYFLNHESTSDLEICSEINSLLKKAIPVVNNANALDVKGLISNSYILISSRYHGVASALNSGVPCLATSWNFKYKELFDDFDQKDNLLNINNIEESILKISSILDSKQNAKIKQDLIFSHKEVKAKNEEMWQVIWAKYGSNR